VYILWLETKWTKPIKVEMEDLEKNNDTWELVPKYEGKKTMVWRWIYALKYVVDGILDKYKTRLIVKGYTQIYGLDYHETFFTNNQD
jgi:hypothetical protein